jgi:release factor glutamine methyltransferase
VKREPLADVRSRFRDEALQQGISPRDVDLFLTDLLGRSLSWILSHGDEMFDPAPLARLMSRRFEGEPVQYIRGRTEFFSREFFVDDRVLIPRPETEILVETVLQRAPERARVIDVGTGSGCIAISLERSRPDLRVTGVDLSLDALAVADLNRRRLSSKARLVASDLLSATHGDVDVIVSNPPYIAETEIVGLAPEVRLYEPLVALTPGPSGLETIERILSTATAPRVFFEIGYGQQQKVRDVAAAHAFEVDAMLPDLAGIDRVVVLSRRG